VGLNGSWVAELNQPRWPLGDLGSWLGAPRFLMLQCVASTQAHVQGAMGGPHPSGGHGHPQVVMLPPPQQGPGSVPQHPQQGAPQHYYLGHPQGMLWDPRLVKRPQTLPCDDYDYIYYLVSRRPTVDTDIGH